VTIANHQGSATVRLDTQRTAQVSWQVTFEPAEIYRFEVDPAPKPTVELIGAFRYRLTWDRSYNNEAGFALYLDDELLAITPGNQFVLRDVPRAGSHSFGVRCVWWDGSMSKEATTVKLPEGFPDELYLSDAAPSSAVQGWGSLTSDRSISGGPLQIGEKTYRKGLGSHAVADIEYELAGRYDRFTAEVGIDQNNGKPEAKVTFEVYADGNLLWESGVMTNADAAKPIDFDIRGAQILHLHVGDGGDGIDYDHADWGDAKVTRVPPGATSRPQTDDRP
jgi:hypothetical protein